LGRTPGDLRALVLTHGHFDHVGFAERARRELGIEVWVHENDVPLTRHPLQYAHERSRLPYAFRPGGLPVYAAMTAQRAILPASIESVRRFGDDEQGLPLPGSLLLTPGHTLGHCGFSLPDRDAVIVGDAIVERDPYTGKRGPRLVSRCAVADSERNLRSLDAIAATGAATVLTGHGEPLTGGAEQAVEAARAAGTS
jgi:glyoxylase-like metal-dependent hydrolase (beta-lactamase superfamily II)